MSPQSYGSLQPKLEVRNGSRLEVLEICRISTLHQDERSLDDQESGYQRWLEQNAELPFQVTVLAGQGSGECLDRAEYRQAIELVESGKLDLVITEDLGRICRRVHAHIFCELCEDNGVRLIAINDHVDTGRDDWRLSSFFAVMRHETYNEDTSARIRRSLRNRFAQGSIFQCPVYGYIKPHSKATDDEISKDPAAESVYDEWFTKLENVASFSEIADWLNKKGVPTGPYCRTKKWNCRIVGRVTRNPILKGLRVRNDRMSKRVNKTGRRKSVKAPLEERLERNCPHLAFIEPKRYDRIIRTLNERNAKYRRKGDNGRDTRRSVPKKRTRWPGQHLFCGICGRMFVWGGHGQTDHLMCDGCRQYKCWQGIAVDGPLAASKMSKAIVTAIEKLPGFESCLGAALHEEVMRKNEARDERLRAIHHERAKRQREIANVVSFIRNGSNSNTLGEELVRLETARNILDEEEEMRQRQPNAVPQLPSIGEIKQLAREAMQRSADDPYEFGRLMRSWIPRIEVSPYRLFDGGRIVLRASFQLTLVPLVPEAQNLDGVSEALTLQWLQVDLFDPPNQRDRYRERVMELKAKGLRGHRIAAKLEITTTAVQRAVVLQCKMDELGLVDPYVPVKELPHDYAKLRRHKHPRYKFEPLIDEDRQ